MKTLLTATAVIEGGASLALLCVPSTIASLLIGAPLIEPAASIVARVGGAGLLALTIACWIARRDAMSLATKGLVGAMLSYNGAVVFILVLAYLDLNLYGVALWPAIILHLTMGIWCIACLVKVQQMMIDDIQ